MRRSKSLTVFGLLGLVLMVGTPSAAEEPVVWELDTTHSTIGFSVRHMMVTTVRGTFNTFSGTVTTAGEDVTAARVSVSIDTASVDTRESRRDQHLRSGDFFEVEAHPTMTFTSTRIERTGSDGLRIEGDLALRGVTRPVVLNVNELTPAITDPGGNQRVGASATARIKRSEFGLTWNRAMEAGGVVVGDDVTIQLDVQLIRRK